MWTFSTIEWGERKVKKKFCFVLFKKKEEEQLNRIEICSNESFRSCWMISVTIQHSVLQHFKSIYRESETGSNRIGILSFRNKISNYLYLISVWVFSGRLKVESIVFISISFVSILSVSKLESYSTTWITWKEIPFPFQFHIDLFLFKFTERFFISFHFDLRPIDLALIPNSAPIQSTS